MIHNVRELKCRTPAFAAAPPAWHGSCDGPLSRRDPQPRARALTMTQRTLADILPPDRNGFGLLRLVLALAVIVSHSFLLTTALNTSEPLFVATGLTLGQHAVQIFFVLSGVMVAASLAAAGSLWHFLAARFLRVMPALAVCVLVTALIIGPLVTTLAPADYFGAPATYLYIAKTLALTTGLAPLPGVFMDTPMAGQVNVPIYTLKYEVICYLLLAAAGALGLFRARALMIAAGIALTLAYGVHQALAGPVAAGGSIDLMLRFLFCFGLGVAAYEARSRLPLHAAGVAGLFLIYALAHDTRLDIPALIVFSAYLALWLGRFRCGRLGAVTARLDLSYGLYIWGWVVMQTLVTTYPAITALPLLGLTLLVALPVATASWLLIERPALGLKRRLRRSPAATGKKLALRALIKDEKVPMSYSTSSIAQARLQRLTTKSAATKIPAKPTAAAKAAGPDGEVTDETAPAPFPTDGIARTRLTRIAGKRV